MEDKNEAKTYHIFDKIVSIYYTNPNSKKIVKNIYELVAKVKDVENPTTLSHIDLIKKFTEIINEVFFTKKSIKRNYFLYVNLNYSKEELKYIAALKDIYVELILRIIKNAKEKEEIKALIDLISKKKTNNGFLQMSASQLVDFHRSEFGFFRFGQTYTRDYIDLVLTLILNLENYKSYCKGSSTETNDRTEVNNDGTLEIVY